MLIKLLFLLAVVLHSAIYYCHIAKKENRFVRFIMTGSIVLIELAVAANVLAVAGCFSLVWLTGYLLISGIVCMVIGRLRRTDEVLEKSSLRESRYDKIMSAILLVAFALYFFFPVNYMLAGRDPGVYLINGVHIAGTGSIEYETDTYLSEHYEELKDIVDLGYPGFYSDYEAGVSENPGDFTTQFLHMFPATLAIGYSLAGLEGLLRVNAILGVFALGMMYLLAKKLFSEKTALLTGILLLVNPAQIWSARIPQSEILSQLILFLGIYLFVAGWEKEERKYSICAGILFALSTFNRMDAYIIGVGILLTCIYGEYTGTKRSYIRYASGWYLVGGIASLWYGFTFSYQYYYDHLGKRLLAILLLNVLLVMLAVLAAVIRAVRIKKAKQWNLSEWIQTHGITIFTFAISAFILFAYILRPRLMVYFENDGERLAMRQFCWYTTIVAIPLMLGAIWKMIRYNSKWEKYLLFLAIAMSNFVIYIFRPSISPDHIWMSRRWIFICIPTVLMLAAYGIELLFKSRVVMFRFVSSAFLIIMLVIPIGRDMVFLTEKMYDGMAEQYEIVATELLEDDAVYFTTSTSLPGIYRYLYDKKIYRLSDKSTKLSEYIKEKEQSQEAVYYIGNPSELDMFVIEGELVEDYIINGTALEHSTEHFPGTTYLEQLDSSIWHLKTVERERVEIDMNTLSLAGTSVREDGCIRINQPGVGFWGPYISVGPGKYKVIFKTDITADTEAMCEVAVNNGMVIAEKKVTDGEVELDVLIDKKMTGLEFRIDLQAGQVACTGITVIKE